MGPLTPQDSRQGESELHEEFQFHLEECARQLRSEGWTAESASAEAQRRFGTVEVHAHACRREAPGATMNRTMGVVAVFGWIGALAGIAVMGAMLYQQQSALVRLEERVAEVAAQSDAEASPPVQPNPGVVFVDGAVARPGVYSLPAMGSLTASRVISAAGGAKGSVAIQVLPELDADARVTEWRANGGQVGVRNGAACLVLRQEDASGVTPRDVALRAGDTVWVERP